MWSISREEESITAELKVRTRDGDLPKITLEESEDGIKRMNIVKDWKPTTEATAMSMKEIQNITGWARSTAFRYIKEDKKVVKTGTKYYWPAP
jgi:hypothetical protein